MSAQTILPQSGADDAAVCSGLQLSKVTVKSAWTAFGHLAGVGVDAAGQVYRQNKCTVFTLAVYQRTEIGRAHV